MGPVRKRPMRSQTGVEPERGVLTGHRWMKKGEVLGVADLKGALTTLLYVCGGGGGKGEGLD